MSALRHFASAHPALAGFLLAYGVAALLIWREIKRAPCVNDDGDEDA